MNRKGYSLGGHNWELKRILYITFDKNHQCHWHHEGAAEIASESFHPVGNHLFSFLCTSEILFFQSLTILYAVEIVAPSIVGRWSLVSCWLSSHSSFWICKVFNVLEQWIKWYNYPAEMGVDGRSAISVGAEGGYCGPTNRTLSFWRIIVVGVVYMWLDVLGFRNFWFMKSEYCIYQVTIVNRVPSY